MQYQTFKTLYKMAHQIHLTIATLELIIYNAKAIRDENPDLTTVIRITKTASRQAPEIEDKIETAILAKTPGIIEG